MGASLVIVFGAGIVRGFARVGFSALSAAGLAPMLLAAGLLQSGFSLALAPGCGVRPGVGMASGFVNGVAAIGGIEVAVTLGTSQLAPAMLARLWFGQRSFSGVSPAQFRRHVLNLLLLIAAGSVGRALLELVGKSGA